MSATNLEQLEAAMAYEITDIGELHLRLHALKSESATMSKEQRASRENEIMAIAANLSVRAKKMRDENGGEN
jgi:FtsZ-binding cell division protein ZapB